MKDIFRAIKTGIKLPFAATWDLISLGNMGEESSTMNVIDEHRRQKRFDDDIDNLEKVFEIAKKIKDTR
jgi:hypothetical protein